MDNVNQDSRREKYYFYNSLSILLKAVEKQQTTIDLRNEAYIFGTVEHADAYVTFIDIVGNTWTHRKLLRIDYVQKTERLQTVGFSEKNVMI